MHVGLTGVIEMPNCERGGCLVVIQVSTTRIVPVMKVNHPRATGRWLTTASMLSIQAPVWSDAVVVSTGTGGTISLSVLLIPPDFWQYLQEWVTHHHYGDGVVEAGYDTGFSSDDDDDDDVKGKGKGPPKGKGKGKPKGKGGRGGSPQRRGDSPVIGGND